MCRSETPRRRKTRFALGARKRSVTLLSYRLPAFLVKHPHPPQAGTFPQTGVPFDLVSSGPPSARDSSQRSRSLGLSGRRSDADPSASADQPTDGPLQALPGL